MACPSQETRKRGFTVAEVLMVLLLSSAVLSLVVVNFFSGEGALDKRPAKDQIRLAVASAHRLARTYREIVFLRHDKEANSITLTNNIGKLIDSYPLPQGADLTIQFFKTLPESKFEEEPSFEPEEHSVQAIPFMPYGPSAPFVVELDQANELTKLRFDPFSSINWKETDAL